MLLQKGLSMDMHTAEYIDFELFTKTTVNKGVCFYSFFVQRQTQFYSKTIEICHRMRPRMLGTKLAYGT